MLPVGITPTARVGINFAVESDPYVGDRRLTDPPLQFLREAVSNFMALADGDLLGVAALHRVTAAMYQLGAAIAQCEEVGIARQDIEGAIAHTRVLWGQSPFMRRIQMWPRGYPGDFETIEYLLRQSVPGQPGTIGSLVDQVILNSPIAQQHRNKVVMQAGEITRVVTRRNDARVLILAAGSCPDLAIARQIIVDRRCSIVVNDSDHDAIAYCQNALQWLGERVSFVHGHAISVARSLCNAAPFDLVLAGGLFDYLPENYARSLLKIITRRLLVSGGMLFFTNIVSPNPYRPFMEYLANWPLIERTKDELYRLLDSNTKYDHAVNKDPTGLSWLVSLHKP